MYVFYFVCIYYFIQLLNNKKDNKVFDGKKKILYSSTTWSRETIIKWDLIIVSAIIIKNKSVEIFLILEYFITYWNFIIWI